MLSLNGMELAEDKRILALLLRQILQMFYLRHKGGCQWDGHAPLSAHAAQ